LITIVIFSIYNGFQAVAANVPLHALELRKFVFSSSVRPMASGLLKIKILAKEKSEFNIFFAIASNGRYQLAIANQK
jgi:hypothetical protein